MQTESRDASWLASYAEVQLILCKDIKKHEITTTFKQETCRNLTFFFEIATGFDDISLFFTFLLFYLSTTFTPAGMNERRLIMPTATTKMRQLSQQKHANCHNKNAPTATTKMRQLPQRKSANCHNEKHPSRIPEAEKMLS